MCCEAARPAHGHTRAVLGQTIAWFARRHTRTRCGAAPANKAAQYGLRAPHAAHSKTETLRLSGAHRRAYRGRP